MSKGAFVLENKRGEVVRTFRWERPLLTLVYRHDTRRVEAVPSVEELEAKNIRFKLLAEVDKKQLQKESVNIGNFGSVKWLPEVKAFRKDPELREESDENAKQIYKWSAGTQAVALILILILGYFLKPEPKLEDQTVVIVPPPAHKKEAAPIVQPSQTRPQRRIVDQPKPKSQKAVVSHRNRTKQIKSVTRKTLVAKTKANSGRQIPKPNMNKMGALGVLADVKSNNRGTGLNLDNMKNNGAGLGSGAGGGGYGAGRKGGYAGSLYGKGLVATAPGGGSEQAQGAGGYGTKGKGGGQKGYGEMSFVGASAGFLEPMEDEIVMDGGLDRDQIAAVINRNRGQIIYCYEKGLQVQSALSGRVAVNFTIGTRGFVNMTKIAQSSLQSDKVESCILGKMRSWKFPRPVGNVQVNVTYPFVLKRLSQR